MIELRDVEVYYYGEKVYDLNIVVPDGRTLILAPCGNGKTTLFRIICGLKEIKDGFVFIDGKDVSFEPPKTRNLALVCEQSIPKDNQKVSDVLAFPLKKRKMPKAERQETIMKTMRNFGLKDVKVKLLNDDEKVSLIAARISERNPYAVLIDEPGLLFGDRKAEIQGVDNVVIASSDPDDIRRYSPDYLIVMRNGKVVAEGKPDEIEGNKFVELFVK